MRVTVVPSRIPTTLVDRLKLAWEGLRTSTKRNPDYWVWREAQEQEEFDRALETIAPEDRECITKSGFYAPTFVFAAFEQAPIDAQIVLLKHIVKANNKIVLDERFRAWATKNSTALAKHFTEKWADDN